MKRSKLRKPIRKLPVWVIRIIAFASVLISPLTVTWILWKDAWAEYIVEVAKLWRIVTGKEPFED